MVEQDWTPSEVTQAHLQDLMSQGFMTTVELATCHVPEDPVSTAPVREYVVACAVFYERGFSVPTHCFLHSLLQYYGLELHHLTSLGIVHIVTFVTVDVSYAAPQAHRIINVALHRKYSPTIIFIFS
jgi:hypothetical protein